MVSSVFLVTVFECNFRCSDGAGRYSPMNPSISVSVSGFSACSVRCRRDAACDARLHSCSIAIRCLRADDETTRNESIT